jgi:hypothetical protein
MEDLKEPCDTLFRIFSNILSSPMEQKFRTLKKTSKAIQSHILTHPSAVEFLLANGFTDEDEALCLKNFDR